MIESGVDLAADRRDVRARRLRPGAAGDGGPTHPREERRPRPVTLGSWMSTLDDAREGMDLAIRPQDDLFGHVNGHWLATAEIPADKGSWGPFVQLADIAEEQVRAIIEELAERVAAARRASTATRCGSRACSPRSWTRTAVEALGTEPLQPAAGRGGSLRDVRDLAAFLGEFEQVGGSGPFGVYVDVDGKNSDRYLVNLIQGGLGLPDESYYRDEKFAEIREKYVAFLTRMFALAGHADPPAPRRP